jgi:2-polyprenyl-6-hydroxyphenyl methylase/3-demethylubiquinone-9 3-methyltransferase
MTTIDANVDPTELAKFSTGDWWDETPGAAYAMLHRLNPLRLKFIKDYTELSHKHVVDIGCGGGILAEALAKTGAQVTGVDLNTEALSQATHNARLQHLNIEYQCLSIEAFAEANPEKFDVLTCMEMLEHVPHPDSIIATAARLLKPHGFAFFSTINRSLRAYLEAIIGAEYLLKLIPRGTHDYKKFIKPSELYKTARKHNLEVIALYGINYHLLNKTFSLSNVPRVNYLIAFKKLA